MWMNIAEAARWYGISIQPPLREMRCGGVGRDAAEMAGNSAMVGREAESIDKGDSETSQSCWAISGPSGECIRNSDACEV